MTPEEARVKIGYTYVATVFSDVQRGRLKLDLNSQITASSVERRARIRKRKLENAKV